MDQYIGKRYKLKSSDNFDEYLKFIGVGYLSRKAACAVTPIAFIIKNDDGTYAMMMSTTIRDVQIGPFKLGEEFTETRPDGTLVKSTVVYEDNKIIHTQVESTGRTSRHQREFKDNLLTVTSTAEGWDGKCVRVYELLP